MKYYWYCIKAIFNAVRIIQQTQHISALPQICGFPLLRGIIIGCGLELITGKTGQPGLYNMPFLGSYLRVLVLPGVSIPYNANTRLYGAVW